MIFKSEQKPGIIGIGPDGRVSNEMLMEMMVNTASEHSDAAGYGINDMKRTHITFLLIDWYVKVDKRPFYGDKLEVCTWGRDISRTILNRDFEIRDKQSKEVLVRASSSWVAFEPDKRKIARITEEIYEPFGPETKKLFDGKDVFLRGREKIDEVILTAPFQPKRDRLDVVGHVHNTAYMAIAEDVLPDEVYEKVPFDEFRIHYKKEIGRDEKVSCAYGLIDGKHSVSITNSEGVENALIQMW